MNFDQEEIPEEIMLLAEKRLLAKKAKNYKLSDQLRNEIKVKGFIILDEKESYRIKKE
jgi:cysteinyl-tRNA synthetase